MLLGAIRIGTGRQVRRGKGRDGQGLAAIPMSPRGMPHYAFFPEETVIQHGIGSQGIIYLNPADAPRKQGLAKAATPPVAMR